MSKKKHLCPCERKTTAGVAQKQMRPVEVVWAEISSAKGKKRKLNCNIARMSVEIAKKLARSQNVHIEAK
jgi:hypothetical protein